jgi:hypothetical protein
VQRINRDHVLSSVDLADLATEICGPPRGRGRSARWHCPNPDHPDRNPSMGIYTSARSGQHRWKCHACGEGGTAVDLLMISERVGAGDALRALADRTGIREATVAPSLRGSAGRPHRPTTPIPPASAMPPPEPALEPHPAIEELVDRAADLLWEPVGSFALRKLRARGLHDAVLRANRVGFDPGPGLLPRPEGLPYRSPGIVFPVLHPHTGTAVFYQLRSLSPRVATERKFDQPIVELAPNPRLAAVRTPAGQAKSDVLVICEGFPDALTAAQAGLPAIALLGTGHANHDGVDSLAHRIVNDYPHPAYAVCLDADKAGQSAATQLSDSLAQQNATVARLLPPDDINDLNDWWHTDSDAVTRLLAGTSKLLTTPLPRPPQLPEPSRNLLHV